MPRKRPNAPPKIPYGSLIRVGPVVELMLHDRTYKISPPLMGLFSETDRHMIVLVDDKYDITAQRTRPAVSEEAIRKFEEFNDKRATKDVRTFGLPDGPFEYEGELQAIVYVSDKAGTTKSQEWIHQCEKKFPHVWRTADESCWIIGGGNMRVESGWLEG